jgi:death-on-curing protein
MLCWHLIRNHPLVDGNKRVGYLCMTEFVERNGYTWRPSDDVTGDDTVEVMVGVADGTLTAEALSMWVRDRMTLP